MSEGPATVPGGLLLEGSEGLGRRPSRRFGEVVKPARTERRSNSHKRDTETTIPYSYYQAALLKSRKPKRLEALLL